MLESDVLQDSISKVGALPLEQETADGLRQHKPLDPLSPARIRIAVDRHGAETHISRGRLEAHRHPVEELSHNQFLLYPDYAVVRSAHSHIGDIRRPVRQNTFVGCRYVRMRTHDCSNASVEIPTEGNLFGRRLGVYIHENHLGP